MRAGEGGMGADEVVGWRQFERALANFANLAILNLIIVGFVCTQTLDCNLNLLYVT